MPRARLIVLIIGLSMLWLAAQQQADPKLERALRDWQAKRPLPGMPNLRKPVFLVKGSLVCDSAGSLINPNKKELLFLGVCAPAPRDIRVSVIPPTDAQEYLRDHYHQIVSVVWHSDEMSNASTYKGWVLISGLRN